MGRKEQNFCKQISPEKPRSLYVVVFEQEPYLKLKEAFNRVDEVTYPEVLRSRSIVRHPNSH